ncbi:Flp pilus assembly protein CpaB [Salidesulfovibrio onnuriiensis]|uniref:Flp pilus assembly protein CpaB n=1 Tax=Salidesulfovibrio onnuriiensis TaxID=2583823 RepID=UPI0011C8170D|nr:Flp pilus assembly protein CpaB [Salidesulfovibrio onnuriiensis]
MSRSSRALAQIGIALLLSLVAAFLIFRWMSAQTAAKPQAQTAPVVVAKDALRKGGRITAELLAVKQFPLAVKPSGTFSEVQALVGKVLSVPVAANEPVTVSKLVRDKVIAGISPLVAPGKRAMSVKGNKVMGLAGFIHPGDRVDVLVSMTEGEKENPVTKVVLEWVKVLATGTQLEPAAEQGGTASVDVYTLELTPEESERLALAASQGELNFALRNAADNATVYTTGQTPKSALAAYRKGAEPRKVKSARSAHSVEVISGDALSRKKF